MMTDLIFRSARQLASLIRRRKVGALELLDLYVQQIERHNSAINAVVVLDVDNARKRARAADRAMMKGQRWGALHGVPMTVKEAFNLIGTPTTWGYPTQKNNIADHNALAVDRLLDAGAIVFGKTNVPQALADWQTFNPIYGTTNNPWDTRLTPGGSSGGSAAALAAGFTALEIGSDIGASIRNPAHYCGVYGHKPTFGVASMSGHALPGMTDPDFTDIAVIGPLARSAADLALSLNVIAGPDPIRATGWQLKLPKSRKTRLDEFKVAVIYDDPEAEVDTTVQDRLRELIRFLKKSGVKVKEDVRPVDSAEAHRIYIQLLRAETSRSLTADEFKRQFARARRLKVNHLGYRAQMLRGNTLSHHAWHALDEARHRMRLAWARFFRSYDLLLCPTATTPAFAHNQKGERWERMLTVNGKQQPTTTPLFWAGYAGVVYLPATVAPIGLTPEGLPVGVQIIGAQYEDHTCIQFARNLEREFAGFIAPPGF